MHSNILYIALVAIFGAILIVECVPTDLNDLKSRLPPELANANFTLNDAKKLLKQKCKKVLDEEESEKAVLEIEKGSQEMMECLSELVNVTSFQLEVEEARPIGELDTVFVKYCGKKDAAIQCVEDYYTKITPCLDEKEKEGSAVMRRVIHSLFNFICYKGGDQIALFYAEKGPECLKQNKEHFGECLNSTFGAYVPKEGVGIPELTTLHFNFGLKQCNDIDIFESCVLDGLDQCEEVTASNIFESMFRFVKNETECPKKSPRQISTRASASTFIQISIFGAMLIVLMQRTFVS